MRIQYVLTKQNKSASGIPPKKKKKKRHGHIAFFYRTGHRATSTTISTWSAWHHVLWRFISEELRRKWITLTQFHNWKKQHLAIYFRPFIGVPNLHGKAESHDGNLQILNPWKSFALITKEILTRGNLWEKIEMQCNFYMSRHFKRFVSHSPQALRLRHSLSLLWDLHKAVSTWRIKKRCYQTKKHVEGWVHEVQSAKDVLKTCRKLADTNWLEDKRYKNRTRKYDHRR